MSPSSLDEDRCRLSITRLVAVTVPRGVVDHIVLVITQGPPLLEPAGVGVVLARQQVGIRGLGSVERWCAHFPSPSLVRYHPCPMTEAAATAAQLIVRLRRNWPGQGFDSGAHTPWDGIILL